MTAFGPKKISIVDIGINALGALLAGFIGSIIILIIVFSISSVISIPGTFETARLDGGSNNPLFPLVLSFITFIATMISFFLTALILHMNDPVKYKNSTTSFAQIGIFGIITYIFLTPIYIYTGLIDYDNIMNVFIIHSIILAFGTSIILEILNNYRYILVGLYGSFVGLFFGSIFTVFLFSSISSGRTKLLSLLIILPLINFCIVLGKGLFELLYYRFYMISNTDFLGDIFYRLEEEEKELLREEELKNNI